MLLTHLHGAKSRKLRKSDTDSFIFFIKADLFYKTREEKIIAILEAN